MIKVALTGKMRSGKDTVSKIMAEKYGFCQFALADNFKHEVKRVGEGLSKDALRKWYIDWGETGRSLLGWECWVQRTIDSIAIHQSLTNHSKYVISDLRDPRDAGFLKLKGFIIIKIDSPDVVREFRAKQSGELLLDHYTERSVDLIRPDFIIHNHLDLQNINSQIEKIADELGWLDETQTEDDGSRKNPEGLPD